MANVILHYGEISARAMRNYFDSLISKTFKILPMKEESSHTLTSYINSYLVEMVGNKSLNPCMFEDNPQLISLLATISYLANEDYDVKTCKMEVFKCIKILEEVRDRNFTEG